MSIYLQLRENRLCYGCLNESHRNKDCTGSSSEKLNLNKAYTRDFIPVDTSHILTRK